MTKNQLIETLKRLDIGLERFTVSHKNYSKLWEEAFELVVSYLSPVLEGARIIHIGSTAIPQCIAKPILDIAIEYSHRSNFKTEIAALEMLGFTSKGAYGVEGREFFTFYSDDERFDFIHLHAFKTNHHHLLNHLTFKDALMSQPSLVNDYNALKHHLVEQGISRKDYPEAKTEFVQSVLNTNP
jgi:GrpB-like predicted nucleotidyltransferase (UPF0157 family)